MPLRQRFMTLNAARSAELSVLRGRVIRGQDAKPNLLAIGDLAHKVAGVASTLGFGELGAKCIALDKITIALRQNAMSFDQAWDQSEELVDQIIELMAA